MVGVRAAGRIRQNAGDRARGQVEQPGRGHKGQGEQITHDELWVAVQADDDDGAVDKPGQSQ